MPHDAFLDLAKRLHAVPPRLVYRFAGAGVGALAAVHAAPGSSRTLLEAVDAYHPNALRDLIGSVPERAASAEVARALAEGARARARALVAHEGDPAPTFGTGLTATIATDRTKRGDHRIEAATADAWGVRTRSLRPRKGARDRAAEERLASAAVLGLIAEASGLLAPLPLPVDADERGADAFEPSERYRAFVERRADALLFAPDGTLGPVPEADRGAAPALVSGSFHPMHEGHLRLAEAAERHLKRPVAFETSPRNAEKSDLDANALRIRATQAAGRRPLVLLHEPLFADKAERLPGTVFVIGVDTAERVVDRRFYDGAEGLDRAMARIRAAGASFLVAGRAGRGRFRELGDLSLPPSGADLFAPLPSFRVDLSSTEIRASWAADLDDSDGAGEQPEPGRPPSRVAPTG